jgi:hypothetical protein
MVEFKCESLFHREVGLLSGFAIAVSMISQGETFPVHVIRIELNLRYFLCDVFHASGFHGQDPGILNLNIMIQVYAVLSHS